MTDPLPAKATGGANDSTAWGLLAQCDSYASQGMWRYLWSPAAPPRLCQVAFVSIFALSSSLWAHKVHGSCRAEEHRTTAASTKVSVYLARIEGKPLSSGSALLGDKPHAVLNQAANFKVTLSF